MVGSIALTEVLRLRSWEAEYFEMTFPELLDSKRADEWYPELMDSMRRNGVSIPILIEEGGFAHGCHRLAAAFDLGWTEIPYTDDPLIGWEETWPEGQPPESWPE